MPNTNKIKAKKKKQTNLRLTSFRTYAVYITFSIQLNVFFARNVAQV